MPLALAETTVAPAPLDKGKGVVVVPSEDEEDSTEGQVFKRRRTTRAAPQVATSTTSSSHGAESLRENHPSATSPPQPTALEGVVEFVPLNLHLHQSSPYRSKKQLGATWRRCLQATKLEGPRRRA